MTLDTQLAVYTPPEKHRGDTFLDPSVWPHRQEVASMLAASEIVPKKYQKQSASCMVALDFAARLGIGVLQVMQSLTVVEGTPGWSAAYIIGAAAADGFPIRWRIREIGPPLKVQRWKWGTERGQKVTVEATIRNLEVIAWSPSLPADEPPIIVTSQQAIDEGWANNPKYSTMTEQMLRYRSATFLARAYKPGILLGLHGEEELEDVHHAEIVSNEPAVSPVKAAAPVVEPPKGLDAVDTALGLTPAATVEPPKAADPAPAKVEPEKPPEKKYTAGEIAELLRAAYTERPAGDRIPLTEVKKRVAELTGKRSIREDAFAGMIRMGAAAGSWHTGDEGATLILGPVPGPKPIVVPDPWVDEDGNPLPVGEQLLEQLKALAGHLFEIDSINAIDRQKNALRRAGIPQVDGSPEPALKRLLVALGEEIEDVHAGQSS